MVTPEKHPANPVVRCGPKGSPDYGHAILYGTVLHDGTKFRMGYLGMIQRELEGGQAPGWWRPMCYAESTDGIAWTKPELGLVDLGGNKKNNVCLVEGEVESMTLVNDFLSVMHDPADPGHCVTSLIDASPRGHKLLLNCSGVSDAAPITVELLDDQDRPIAGYAGSAAARVTADGTRQPIVWAAPAKDQTPLNQPFAVRVHLPDNDAARLFAVYVE